MTEPTVPRSRLWWRLARVRIRGTRAVRRLHLLLLLPSLLAVKLWPRPWLKAGALVLWFWFAWRLHHAVMDARTWARMKKLWKESHEQVERREAWLSIEERYEQQNKAVMVLCIGVALLVFLIRACVS